MQLACLLVGLASLVQRFGQHLPLFLQRHSVEHADLGIDVFQSRGLAPGLLRTLHEVTIQAQCGVQAQLLHLPDRNAQADKPRLHALHLRQRQLVLGGEHLQLLPGRSIQVTLELAAIGADRCLHHAAGQLWRLHVFRRQFEHDPLRGLERLFDIGRQRVVLRLQQVEGTEQVEARVARSSHFPQQRHRRLGHRCASGIGLRGTRCNQRCQRTGRQYNGGTQQGSDRHISLLLQAGGKPSRPLPRAGPAGFPAAPTGRSRRR